MCLSKSKVAAVADFPAPQTPKQVRSFIGLSSRYRKFIPQYSSIVAPLTDLTKKGRKFQWGSLQEKAFDEIKKKLISPPILNCPDFNLPFEIQTDASHVGLGAVLLQHVDADEKVVAYWSAT